MASMFMSGFGTAMLGDEDALPLDEASPPDHRQRAALDPMEEDLQDLSNNFFDFVSKAKQAGSALLDAANRSVLGGPLAEVLAPEREALSPKPRHRPVIAVMGSGTFEYLELAEPLGQWIARANFHLLTGGGGGVMHATSRAFTSVPERHGACLGVIPCSNETILVPKEGYPNPYVEIPILTQLSASLDGDSLLSRNHINALSATVMIALPGARGTASEVRHALDYGRPVCFYQPEGYPSLPGLDLDSVTICHTLEEVVSFVHTSLLADMNASVQLANDVLIPPPRYATTVSPSWQEGEASGLTTTACTALSQFTQTPCAQTLDFGVQVDIYDVVTVEAHEPSPRTASVINYQPSASGEVDLVTPVFQLAATSPQGSLETEPLSPAALELQLAMATPMEAVGGSGEDDGESYQLLPSSSPPKQ